MGCHGCIVAVVKSAVTCLTELRPRVVKTPTSSSQPSDSGNVTSSGTGACCACPKTAEQLEIEERER